MKLGMKLSTFIFRKPNFWFIFFIFFRIACPYMSAFFSCQNLYFSKKIVHNFTAVPYEFCLFSFMLDKGLLVMVQPKSSLQWTANRVESKKLMITLYFVVMTSWQTFLITTNIFSLILVYGLNSNWLFFQESL